MLLLEYDPFYSIAVDSARRHRKSEQANERHQHNVPPDNIIFETPPHAMCQEIVMEIIYGAIHYSEQHVKGCAQACDAHDSVRIPEESIAEGRPITEQNTTADTSMEVVQELVDVDLSIVSALLSEMTEVVVMSLAGPLDSLETAEASVILHNADIQPRHHPHTGQDSTTASIVSETVLDVVGSAAVEPVIVGSHVLSRAGCPKLDAPPVKNDEGLPIVDDEHSSPPLPNDEDEAEAHAKQKYMLPEEQQKEFEALWQTRKATAEAAAESNARVTFRKWQRDRLTLEQAIEGSLKEYAELYERAHALRLMFEEEKAQWSRKVQQESMQGRMQDRVQERAEESPYCWDVKRQRTEGWGSAYSTAPYQQYQQQHNQVSPYSFAFPSSQPRGALLDEFQYAVEESQEMELGGSGVGDQAAPQHSDMCGLSPLKKQQKKFTVPVKMT